MPSFTNREDFEKWLADKPAEWAQLLALRSALRVLPIALDPTNFRQGPALARLTGAIFRTCATSWAACHIPAHEMAARAAANAADAAAVAARAAAFAAAFDAGHTAAFAAYAAASDADVAVAFHAAAAAAESATYAAADVADAAWNALSADAEWLEQSDQPTIGLLARPLWPKGDNPFSEAWARASAWLRANSLSLWAGWFQRRLDGHAAGFALPADADREIAGRLLSADNEWWTGGENEPGLEQFQRVTREIESWIAELQLPAAVEQLDKALKDYEDLIQPEAPPPVTADRHGIGGNAPPESERILPDDLPLDRKDEGQIRIVYTKITEWQNPGKVAKADNAEAKQVLEEKQEKISKWAQRFDVFWDKAADSGGTEFGKALGKAMGKGIVAIVVGALFLAMAQVIGLLAMLS
jgi:hypothetical protein